MGRSLVPPVIEIYLCDETGVRIECLDYVSSYSYALATNTPSPFSLTLPAKFNRSHIKLDGIVEIWRGFGPGSLKLDYCGFIRNWMFGDNAGNEFTVVGGVSVLDLLRRRIVFAYAGSAGADKTDQADDMIKAIVTQQCGTAATAERSISADGGGFTVQGDLADGQSITKAFAWRNVLTVCQDVAQASAQAGTEVYFDIIPNISSNVTGALAFELRTYTDQRGADRTEDSDAPLFVGPEWGNFENGSLSYDHSNEANYVYVLGAGEGTDREVTGVGGGVRQYVSIWNRCEGAKDARNTAEGAADERTAEGQEYLWENRPVFSFSGDIVETPSFRYGRDWHFGDRITASYAGVQKDAMIKAVLVERGVNGQEKITAKLEVEA